MTTLERGFFSAHTVATLGALLRDGALTSVDLVDRSLRSIDKFGGRLGAFVHVDDQGARDAAVRADVELSRGENRGPLHGIPVAVKDNIEVAGLPMTAGSAHFATRVSTVDAEVVGALRRNGAVIVGTTTMHEFAYGPTGDVSASGPSRNPHDPARMSGGSSGGSAAAVAAGLVPLALGTDTGGSVRIPAALCGIAGFKPAFGALPTGGVYPLARSLDHVGLLAATAEDCRLAYAALSGEHTNDIARPPAARVCWVRPTSLFDTNAVVEALARRALDRAREDTCVVAGAEDLPHARFVADAYAVIQGSEAYAVHADRYTRRAELYHPEVRERLREASEIAGWRYVRALDARADIRREVDTLLSAFDLLALPTVPVTAPLLGQREIDIDGVAVSVRSALLSMTRPWSLLGLPALTVPVGTLDTLPVGLQLVCALGREPLLFAVAEGLASGRPPGAQPTGS